ncbi:MAG: aquaporin, partial [Rhodothermales bacterium]
WMRGTTKTPEAFRYIAVQLVAAFSAAFVSLWLLNGATFSPGVGAEHSVWQALMAEFLFTFALVLVILNVAIAETTAGNQFYGIAIGFVVMAGAYAVWDISGAAFNPAVALGGLVIEAVVYDRSLEEAWIYLVGPLSGAAFAAVVFGWQQD